RGRLPHAATEIGARVVLLGDDPVLPGEEAFVQLVWDQPIAAAAGDRFVLRDTTAQRTIGGGVFIDLRAPARKRRTPERLAQLEALAFAEPEQALAALLDQPPFHLDLNAFAPAGAVPCASLDTTANRLDLIRIATPQSLLTLSTANWLRFKRSVLATLTQFHADNPDLPGLGRERLRLQIEPRLPAPAFLAGLRTIARSGDLILEGAWVRLCGHEGLLAPARREGRAAPRARPCRP